MRTVARSTPPEQLSDWNGSATCACGARGDGADCAADYCVEDFNALPDDIEPTVGWFRDPPERFTDARWMNGPPPRLWGWKRQRIYNYSVGVFWGLFSRSIRAEWGGE